MIEKALKQLLAEKPPASQVHQVLAKAMLQQALAQGGGGSKPSAAAKPTSATSALTTASPAAVAAAAANIPTFSLTGTKRALLVGINYFGTKAELSGCVNDVSTMKQLITNNGWQESNITVLTDDPKMRTTVPTYANILKALKDFSGLAKPGDHLFLHFSGHGTQIPDDDGDEESGQDQGLVPADYTKAGILRDDDVFEAVCTPLPAGCKLTCVIDCCHSGSIIDLPWSFVASTEALGQARASVSAAWKQPQKPISVKALVIMFSGCKDTQESADVDNIASFGSGGQGAGGALVSSFVAAMKQSPEMPVLQLLSTIQKGLKQRGYTQVPQLSASHPLPLTTMFTLVDQRSRAK